jgi:hypothetical protein
MLHVEYELMRKNAMAYENNANSIRFFIYKGMVSWMKCFTPKEASVSEFDGNNHTDPKKISDNLQKLTAVLADSLIKNNQIERK